eukprot:CAMPEP_0172890910 /NCGR_PEP_ID=MMETSP1075-20121228/142447_1 /TAXON_ID=2916 /ORGANISM="Ceratium fusus, Strain PA161109" /LENGTH=103 /DNA_ID=CAMNT_0013745257 /DNA_START=131 /DNA_END=442 /DNA_ORIENTATION=-
MLTYHRASGLEESIANEPRGEEGDRERNQEKPHCEVVLCFEISPRVENCLDACVFFIYDEVVGCIGFATIAEFQDCANNSRSQVEKNAGDPDDVKKFHTECQE